MAVIYLNEVANLLELENFYIPRFPSGLVGL